MSEIRSQLINEHAWLDLSDGTVSFGISDRVTLTLRLEEFMDFLNNVSSISEALKAADGVTLGTYEKDGDVYQEFMLTPDEGDFN